MSNEGFKPTVASDDSKADLFQPEKSNGFEFSQGTFSQSGFEQTGFQPQEPHYNHTGFQPVSQQGGFRQEEDFKPQKQPNPFDSAAFTQGFAQGFSQGYTQGFVKGSASGEDTLGFLKAAGDAPRGFQTAPIYGGIATKAKEIDDPDF